MEAATQAEEDAQLSRTANEAGDGTGEGNGKAIFRLGRLCAKSEETEPRGLGEAGSVRSFSFTLSGGSNTVTGEVMDVLGAPEELLGFAGVVAGVGVDNALPIGGAGGLMRGEKGRRRFCGCGAMN